MVATSSQNTKNLLYTTGLSVILCQLCPWCYLRLGVLLLPLMHTTGMVTKIWVRTRLFVDGLIYYEQVDEISIKQLVVE